MVYQIFSNEKRTSSPIFDIEMYLDERPNKQYVVEMHATPTVEGLVDFVMEKCVENIFGPLIRVFDFGQFKKDCDEITNLRFWMFEYHRNIPRSFEEATKDKDEWFEHVKEVITNFADKYGLYINVD